MPDPLEHVEQRLIAGYQKQGSLYESALRLLQERAGPASDADRAHHLNEVLHRVASIETEFADARAIWRQSGKTPGTELRAVLERVAEQLRILGGLIESQVAELLVRKQRLAPAIDDFIRQRSMLNAYGQTVQQAPR